MTDHPTKSCGGSPFEARPLAMNPPHEHSALCTIPLLQHITYRHFKFEQMHPWPLVATSLSTAHSLRLTRNIRHRNLFNDIHLFGCVVEDHHIDFGLVGLDPRTSHFPTTHRCATSKLSNSTILRHVLLPSRFVLRAVRSHFCKRCTAQGGVHESGARVARTWLGVRPWCGVVGRGSNDKTIHGPSRTTRPGGAVDPSHLIGPSTDPQEGSFLAARRPNRPAPPAIKPSFSAVQRRVLRRNPAPPPSIGILGKNTAWSGRSRWMVSRSRGGWVTSTAEHAIAFAARWRGFRGRLHGVMDGANGMHGGPWTSGRTGGAAGVPYAKAELEGSAMEAVDCREVWHKHVREMWELCNEAAKRKMCRKKKGGNEWIEKPGA